MDSKAVESEDDDDKTEHEEGLDKTMGKRAHTRSENNDSGVENGDESWQAFDEEMRAVRLPAYLQGSLSFFAFPFCPFLLSFWADSL